MTALTQGDFAEAASFSRQLRAAAADDASGVLAVEADTLLGFAAFWLADFPTARDHLELAVDRYRPEHSREHLIHYGQDPKVVALARLGNTRWFLGDADGARSARAAALAWADEVGHPFSRAAVLLFGSLLALDMGDEADLRGVRGRAGRGPDRGAADPAVDQRLPRPSPGARRRVRGGHGA